MKIVFVVLVIPCVMTGLLWEAVDASVRKEVWVTSGSTAVSDETELAGKVVDSSVMTVVREDSGD